MERICVAGVDLSLTGTGVTLAPLGGDASDVVSTTFGSKGKKDETLEERWKRMSTIAAQVKNFLSSASAVELILIETPAYMSTYGKTHDRSGLWWETYRGIREIAPVVGVVPTKVKMYATGSGKADKDGVIMSVLRRYPDASITNNNEADSFTLAAMAARLAGNPLEESLPQTHLRAMEGLVMP